MLERLYSKFTGEQLILRDHLAADRTILANERTFLAYIRTALTLFIAGVSFLHFFTHALVVVSGWVFLCAGIFVFVFGLWRYGKMRRLIDVVRRERSGVASSE